MADSLYGEDGILVTQARTFALVERLVTTTDDTNAQVKRINGTVASLVKYRDEVPSELRTALLPRVLRLLEQADAADERDETRRRDTVGLLKRWGYDTLKLATAIAIGVGAARLGLQ